jgi:integrase
MARTVRDANLESRTARSRLKASGKPYFRSLEHGLHLGYRKPLSGPGKWVARHYVGKQTYETETIGSADDFSDADGVAILDFRQAQEKARSRMVARAHAAVGKTGPLTVSVVMDQYIDFLEAERKSGDTARYSVNAFVRPTLGDVEVESLTVDQLRRWHKEIARSSVRVRTPPGEKQRYKAVDVKDDEWRRRRRSTANRILKILKGGLNHAWRDGKVTSDAAWRRVVPFEGVESARVRYLTVAEAQRLINAAESSFRKLVEGALQTGARYGELCRLIVSDLNADTGTVAVRVAKGGRPRHIVLTDEGLEFFRSICIGRAGSEPMFTKATGAPWAKAHQSNPMKATCKRANITPAINFHGLRHTWASHAVMNGVPLLVVARNLGHADTKMVEQHYGHMSSTYIADAIRAGAPRFGTVPKTNVTSLGR